VSQRIASVSMCISESLNAMPCFWAIAWSNASRSFAYGIAYSITARARPVITAASPAREWLSSRRTSQPASPPSRASAGSSTRSSSSRAFGSARRPSCFSGSEIRRPAASRGTMNASCPPLLRAITRKWLARSASGTKLFAPDTTKPLPFGSAIVRGSSGSNTGPGSTQASAAAWKRSPQNSGSSALRCASVPWSITAFANAAGASAATASVASPHASSSPTIAFVTGERGSPAPP
jgi:hypothetical protein